MTKEYGKVTIGVYLVYDVISFGCFYSAIKMGVDIGALLTKVCRRLQPLALPASWPISALYSRLDWMCTTRNGLTQRGAL